MIATIIIVSLALVWLLVETDFMHVRLPCGAVSKSVITTSTLELKTKPLEIPRNDIIPPILLLPEVCQLTKIQREFADTKYRDSWRYGTSYNIIRQDSYQQMIIGNQTITLNATSPNLYELIAEVSKVQTEKPRKPSYRPCRLPEDAFIETIRTGSHNEFHETTPKHGYNVTVSDFTTHYHDCLPGKKWLKAHINDHKEFEPTIELMVSGKTLTINGNYKTGMIKQAMKV